MSTITFRDGSNLSEAFCFSQVAAQSVLGITE